MSALLELAERCESATGPDREIDREIAIASGEYIYERRERDRKEWFYPLAANGYRRQIHGLGNERLPAYTASLDAAITLVPEGCDRWAICFVDDPETGKEFIAVVGGDEHHRTGVTPALALCAAALRARYTGEQP